MVLWITDEGTLIINLLFKYNVVRYLLIHSAILSLNSNYYPCLTQQIKNKQFQINWVIVQPKFLHFKSSTLIENVSVSICMHLHLLLLLRQTWFGLELTEKTELGFKPALIYQNHSLPSRRCFHTHTQGIWPCSSLSVHKTTSWNEDRVCVCKQTD